MTDRLIPIACIAACAGLFAGCGGVSTTRIATDQVQVANHLARCVDVKVAGGADQSALFAFEATTKKYDTALRKMIATSKVFSGFCAKGQPGMRLDVTVFKRSQSQPNGMLEMTSVVPVNWRLANPATGQVLYQQRLDGTGTKKTLSGPGRIIQSTELAMRDSIVRGLEAISRLSLTNAP